MTLTPPTSDKLPSLIQKHYPLAPEEDVVEMVTAFLKFRLALADGENGYAEEILYNRAFSKVDSTRFKEAPKRQQERYTAAKGLMLAQLGILHANALAEYEDCCLECVELVKKHNLFADTMTRRLAEASSYSDYEIIKRDIERANVEFATQMQHLKERADHAKR